MRIFITLLIIIFTNQLYGQLQTPQWEMAFKLEDRSGDKDTLYLGVDSLATFGFDSLFEKIDTLAFDGTFKTLIVGSGAGGKGIVNNPDSFGFGFHIYIFDAYKSFEIELDKNKLADTSNGIKNLIWHQSTQSYWPDIYKGSQMWFTLNVLFDGAVGNCGAHSETLSMVGGIPKLPGMESEPVCYLNGNVLSVVGNIRDSNDRFDASIYVELKPMNILGSPRLPNGIKKMQKPNISFYPNPVNDFIQIINNETFQSEIQIIDQFGSIIRNNRTAPNEFLIINMKNLTNGLYYLRIITPKGVYSTKIVKN